ncbi:hybrid sensor histidine kinase/response regulator [Bdellovibrio svalbardensis]|uniref:histidine kinase n=1 Tax=Bdellovibrio svalbardensis TaxID=2972972 RepID=A0ABT6DL79_9BACT|nr:response regulator [Bdellovibrio svalbardensis]MDG0817628.1 response regulator [Bdellovibrio svalbardensis]
MSITLFIGLLTIVEYVGGYNFGIDELFFKDQGEAVLTIFPGRMAVVAASCFVLLSGSLLLLSIKTLSARERNFIDIGAFATIALLVPSILGYILGLQRNTSFYPYAQIALHTAFALLLCAVGIIALNSLGFVHQVATSKTIGGRNFRTLTPALILALVTAKFLISYGEVHGYYDSKFSQTLFISTAIFEIVAISLLQFFSLNKLNSEIIESDRKAQSAEARLKYNETIAEYAIWNNAILENANSSIISSDPNGVIRTFNKKAEQLLGYQRDEMIGKKTPEIIHDPQEVVEYAKTLSSRLGREISPGFEAFVAMAREDGADEREWTYIRKDGTTLPVFLSVTAVKNQKNEIIGYLGIANDISEKKEVDRKLRTALSDANASLKAKDIFLANMSHEIRTPMNGIIGMSDLLLETPLSDEQSKYVHVIQKSGDQLLGVINDILDFSKIQSGGFSLDLHPFSLVELLENQMEMFKARANEKGLSLMSYIDSNVPNKLIGDSFRIAQVITNLVGNAIKFTQRGGVTLFVETLDSGSSVCDLKISVVDTGIGISSLDMTKLFSPFIQADNSTSRHFGGTGLGLSISKSLVQLMNGEIGLKSEEKMGSTFWVRLKLSPAEDQDQTALENDFASLQYKKILVVDDDPLANLVLEKYLSSWGFQVITTLNVSEALAELQLAVDQRSPFSVAIIDKRLSEMDGLDLARMIKSNLELASTPLILMTAHNKSGLKEEALRTYFSDVLIKPFRRSELQKALKQLLLADKTKKPLSVSQVLPANNSKDEQTKLGRILVAEDNQVNQLVTRTLLEQLQYSVLVVSNGNEALKEVFSEHFDLVFMDCQMPDLDGYQTTVRIRKAEAGTGRHIPIVALTANAMEQDREMCVKSGMDDYLAKPVKKVVLEAMLKKWLRTATSINPSPGLDRES